MKTIELVGYGHPDRFADYISEKILVENLKQDPKAKVAAEVMVTRNIVFLGGEIYSKAKIDYKKLVYEAIEKVYGNK
jgi:S-adenosylmethionine synthetase